MKISVIMVNYKACELVRARVREMEEPPIVARIIVIDNSGELPKRFSDEFTKLIVIRNETNVGFGAAVNQAIPLVNAEWMLVMNPDVRLKKGCLSRLMDAAINNDSPIVGPRFYWDDHCRLRLPPSTGSSLWLYTGQRYAQSYVLDAKLYSFYWQVRHDRFWQASEPFYEPFLSGACLLINTDWVRSIGNKLFDDRFFMYFEDTDLCARSVVDGIHPMCVPGAEAVHYYSHSQEEKCEKYQMMQSSEKLFLNKYYDKIKSIVIDPAVLSRHVEDLGEIDRAPVFEDINIKNKKHGKQYFEIAENLVFVPFVQALADGRRFEFPPEVWNRLSAGTYYGRFRCNHFEPVKTWKWMKI